MEILRCAVRNLLRKRLRTTITVSGIAVGVLSVLIIGAIGTAGATAVNNELDNLGMNGISITVQKGKEPLSNQDLEMVKKIPVIRNATPVLNTYAEVSCRGTVTDAMIWGIDAGEQVVSMDSRFGRILTDADIKSDANVCLVDINLARNLYQRDNIVGKTLTLMIGGIHQEYEVVGVVSADSGILSSLIGDVIPAFVYVPYTKLQQLMGTGRLGQIAVEVRDGADYEDALLAIESAFQSARGRDEVRIDNLSRQRDQLGNLLNIIKSVLSAIGGVSLLVAGLGIMTVMLVSVNERTKEIGIKKAIGARSFTILMEFLCEALVISMAGSAAGALMGFLAVALADQLFGFQLTIEFSQLMGAIFTAILTAMIFGVYPASKAASLRPVDALRQE